MWYNCTMPWAPIVVVFGWEFSIIFVFSCPSQNDIEQRAEKSSQYVMNELLTAKCPNCNKVIPEMEWQQRNALQCDGCEQHLCAWCFEAALTQASARYCSERCAMECDFEKDEDERRRNCVRRRREMDLDEYLNSLPYDEKTRVMSRVAGEAKQKGVGLPCS